MIHTRYQQWYKDLSAKEKRQYAKRAGITINIISSCYLRPLKRRLRTHNKLFQSTHAQPPSSTMLRLSKASRGAVGYEDMLDHFYRK